MRLTDSQLIKLLRGEPEFVLFRNAVLSLSGYHVNLFDLHQIDEVAVSINNRELKVFEMLQVMGRRRGISLAHRDGRAMTLIPLFLFDALPGAVALHKSERPMISPDGIWLPDEDESDFKKQSVCELCFLMVERLSHIAAERELDVSTQPDHITAAQEFIRKNFTGDLSLEEVASHVQLSTWHLSHLFKEQTGEGFTQFLRRVRIDHAKELLLDTDMSIMQISIESGFNNASHFSRIFRKETSFTPGDWRREYSA